MATVANAIQPSPAQRRGLGSATAMVRELRSGRQARTRLARAALHALAQLVRRGVSVVTLAVPLSYIICALLATGVFRQDLVVGPLRHGMEAIVLPGKAIAARIFAVPIVFHGLDLILVGWGLVTLVLREVVLEPFRKAESWSAEKLQLTVAARNPARRPHLRKMPRPCHS